MALENVEWHKEQDMPGARGTRKQRDTKGG